MSDFVSQPLDKLLNKRNPLTRIERLEAKTSAGPSAIINELQEFIQNQPSFFRSGVVFVGDSNNPYFIFQDLNGKEIARVFQDGANNLQFNLSIENQIFTFNNGAVISSQNNSYLPAFVMHYGYVEKAALYWNPADDALSLRNTSGGNTVIAFEGNDGDEQLGLYDLTAGVDRFIWKNSGLHSLRETSTTDLPAANYIGLFASTDGHIYQRSPDGTDKAIDSTGGTSSPSFLPVGSYRTVSPFSADPSYPYSATIDRTTTFVNWAESWYVATTNNGSNYWVITMKTAAGTTINAIDTSGGAADTWNQSTDNSWSVASVGAADKVVYFVCTKVGSPGDMYLAYPCVEVTY